MISKLHPDSGNLEPNKIQCPAVSYPQRCGDNNDYIDDAVVMQRRIERGMKKVSATETLIDALHIRSPIHKSQRKRSTMHVVV